MMDAGTVPSLGLVVNAVLFMLTPTLERWNRGNAVLILEALRGSMPTAMDLSGA